MKRFICILVSVLFACSAFAQLTQVQSAYKSVYKWNGMPRHGEIRHNGEFFYLCGESMNRFESSMHTIILGETKEEAIISLRQLDSLRENMGRKDEVKVVGIGGKTTTIFKVMGSICFSTDGVANMSDCFVMFKLEKAIQAINDFGTEKAKKETKTSDEESYNYNYQPRETYNSRDGVSLRAS